MKQKINNSINERIVKKLRTWITWIIRAIIETLPENWGSDDDDDEDDRNDVVQGEEGILFKWL